MNCIVSTKQKEQDGTYSVLVTCLECGYSMRVENGFGSIICLSCSTKLVESTYLSYRKIQETVQNLKKEAEQELQATANTIIAGFSPAKPFVSYKRKRERFNRISALPKMIQKMKRDRKKS